MGRRAGANQALVVDQFRDNVGDDEAAALAIGGGDRAKIATGNPLEHARLDYRGLTPAAGSISTSKVARDRAHPRKMSAMRADGAAAYRARAMVVDHRRDAALGRAALTDDERRA